MVLKFPVLMNGKEITQEIFERKYGTDEISVHNYITIDKQAKKNVKNMLSIGQRYLCCCCLNFKKKEQTERTRLLIMRQKELKKIKKLHKFLI